jgi:hypothetical protein
MSDDPDRMPDPESPECTVAWAAKRVLRLHLGPRYKRFLPRMPADEIVKALRGSKWRIIKEPPNPPQRLMSDGRELHRSHRSIVARDRSTPTLRICKLHFAPRRASLRRTRRRADIAEIKRTAI